MKGFLICILLPWKGMYLHTVPNVQLLVCVPHLSTSIFLSIPFPLLFLLQGPHESQHFYKQDLPTNSRCWGANRGPDMYRLVYQKAGLCDEKPQKAGIHNWLYNSLPLRKEFAVTLNRASQSSQVPCTPPPCHPPTVPWAKTTWGKEISWGYSVLAEATGTWCRQGTALGHLQAPLSNLQELLDASPRATRRGEPSCPGRAGQPSVGERLAQLTASCCWWGSLKPPLPPCALPTPQASADHFSSSSFSYLQGGQKKSPTQEFPVL